VAARGQYLVNNVLGCAGCHTPQGGALLSGTDCFVKSGTTGCLSSANLTNDPSGLMNLTNQQIKDAFTKGIDPEDSNKYLFSNMPYYQFANLTSADADAIVAYLRTVPGVSHTVQAATAPFDVQPSTPDWAPVDPATLPAAGAAAGPANGKYLATLTTYALIWLPTVLYIVIGAGGLGATLLTRFESDLMPAARMASQQPAV